MHTVPNGGMPSFRRRSKPYQTAFNCLLPTFKRTKVSIQEGPGRNCQWYVLIFANSLSPCFLFACFPLVLPCPCWPAVTLAYNVFNQYYGLAVVDQHWLVWGPFFFLSRSHHAMGFQMDRYSPCSMLIIVKVNGWEPGIICCLWYLIHQMNGWIIKRLVFLKKKSCICSSTSLIANFMLFISTEECIDRWRNNRCCDICSHQWWQGQGGG